MLGKIEKSSEVRLTLGALAFSLLAGTASAQIPCGERNAIVAQLSSKYGETRRSYGTTVINGTVMLIETWASESGSWTVLRTRPDGVTCLLGAGQGYEAVEPEKGAPL